MTGLSILPKRAPKRTKPESARRAKKLAEKVNFSVTKDYAGELVYFAEGDASKFFIKKYPELLMSFLTDDQLEQILDDWVCTCYERRILYFVDINKLQSLIDLLLEFKFDTSICYNKIWPLVDCIIENDPEAPEHDTFVLITKRDLIPNSSIKKQN